MYLNGIKLVTILLAITAITIAYPYSWGMHQSNYDASLDPIVWSRSFVKDSIRRPRLLRSNSVDEEDGDDEIRFFGRKTNFPTPQSHRYGRRHSTSMANYADFANTRYTVEPSPNNHKFNAMRKRFNRRRLQKFNHYGYV
ncbi:uncharacterized protein LOC142241046 [Haematobia irritans]|uniref:uncharacterized protein LOC142241046 n=1 Tax=Haematobia irritans TaxID=7368 RepID=UPI003F4F707A